MQEEMQRKIDAEVWQSTKQITPNTTKTRKTEVAHDLKTNYHEHKDNTKNAPDPETNSNNAAEVARTATPPDNRQLPTGHSLLPEADRGPRQSGQSRTRKKRLSGMSQMPNNTPQRRDLPQLHLPKVQWHWWSLLCTVKFTNNNCYKSQQQQLTYTAINNR